MENCVPPDSNMSVFDLKGCTYGRSSEQGTGYEENLFMMTKGFPLFFVQQQHDQIYQAIFRDSSMLCDMKVQDYSLLLGIDNLTNEVVMRIIDYGRGYGMVEAAERFV